MPIKDVCLIKVRQKTVIYDCRLLSMTINKLFILQLIHKHLADNYLTREIVSFSITSRYPPLKLFINDQ